MDFKGEFQNEIAENTLTWVFWQSTQDNEQRNEDTDHGDHRIRNFFNGKQSSPCNLSNTGKNVLATNRLEYQVTGTVGWQELKEGPEKLKNENDSPNGKGKTSRCDQRLILSGNFGVGGKVKIVGKSHNVDSTSIKQVC